MKKKNEKSNCILKDSWCRPIYSNNFRNAKNYFIGLLERILYINCKMR